MRRTPDQIAECARQIDIGIRDIEALLARKIPAKIIINGSIEDVIAFKDVAGKAFKLAKKPSHKTTQAMLVTILEAHRALEAFYL